MSGQLEKRTRTTEAPFLVALTRAKTGTGHTTANKTVKPKLCFKRKQDKLLPVLFLPYTCVTVVIVSCWGNPIFCFTFGWNHQISFWHMCSTYMGRIVSWNFILFFNECGWLKEIKCFLYLTIFLYSVTKTEKVLLRSVLKWDHLCIQLRKALIC